eukprot:TRINITY_DN11715_c0_g1_i1.p1 TRINITY_DN11715_c0_g1~~TRINITY_DN11715_c0_g1_i1.p1  ORF type:complete len:190 (+),score=13.31 TRINITY_DN11715_c0_g1_i1:188-757(+)
MATHSCNPTAVFRFSSSPPPPLRTFSHATTYLPGCSPRTISSIQRSSSKTNNLLFRRNLLRFRSDGRRSFLTGKSVISCGVTVIKESEFSEKVLMSDLPVLVEFVADWCGPCRLITPVIDWASQEYKERLKIVKIDHDSNPRLIEEYKVYGLPALILFKNGQEVPESRREGAMTKVKLKEYLESLLESM